MRSTRRLFAVGFVTFVVGLIVLFPARIAVSWFAPEGIAISKPAGTVWSGSAVSASVAGIYVEDISWQFRPLSLFSGRLAYSVEASPGSGFIETTAAVGFGGTITLSDLRGALPLQLFAGSLGIPGLRGNASLNFERAEIVDGFAQALDGGLQVADVVVPIIGNDSLGGYKADFFTQNNGVSASVEDTDGVVDLAGSFELKPDRSYSFIAQVVRREDTPQSIVRQLEFLPPPNNRGQQEIRLEGVF